MKPVTFDNCFGAFYHGWSRKGVVLCNSFGLENLRYQRSLSHLAETLAGRGLNVLHFDYFGTGESAGTTLDPGILDRWLHNTRAAAEWLREQGNAEVISYAGLRLGAMIAAMAANNAGNNDAQPLDELILLAPPASGATFVAELVHAAEALGQSQQELSPERKLPFDGVDIGGYRLGGSTIQELQTFRWDRLQSCRAGRVKILAENRVEDQQLTVDAFAGIGCKVDMHNGIEGFDRATTDMRAAKRDAPHWDAAASLIDVPAGGTGILPKPATVLPMNGPGYLETPVFLDSSDQYSGIFCQASGGEESRMAVLFLPTAEGHALSWPRLPVDLSRRFSRNGIACLRLSNQVLANGPALETASYRLPGSQIEAAISWLKNRRYSYITLIGGTETDKIALETAANDARICQLLLLDKPPLPLGFGNEYSATRADDQRDPEANENDAPGSLPDRMRAMRSSLDAIQRVKDFALDRKNAATPLEQRLAAFSQSGKPLALMYCAGAPLSADLDSFDCWISTGGNDRQTQPSLNAQAVAIESPDGLLASDAARNSTGDHVMELMQKVLTSDPGKYRLAIRWV